MTKGINAKLRVVLRQKLWYQAQKGIHGSTEFTLSPSTSLKINLAEGLTMKELIALDFFGTTSLGFQLASFPSNIIAIR